MPPHGTRARMPFQPNTWRAYRLKLNNSKPAIMSQPAACSQRDAPQTRNARPVSTKPSEWNCCWLKAFCTAVGTPPANTGRCANAALNTTLAQALMAPSTKNHRADSGQTSDEETEAKAEDGLGMGEAGRKAKKGTRTLKHVCKPCEPSTKNAYISGLR
jgi:hypothetical protein